jgi:hypothetical protein
MMRGFMALMPAPRGVAPEHIAAGEVWVATGANRQIAGLARTLGLRRQ